MFDLLCCASQVCTLIEDPSVFQHIVEAEKTTVFFGKLVNFLSIIYWCCGVGDIFSNEECTWINKNFSAAQMYFIATKRWKTFIPWNLYHLVCCDRLDHRPNRFPLCNLINTFISCPRTREWCFAWGFPPTNPYWCRIDFNWSMWKWTRAELPNQCTCVDSSITDFQIVGGTVTSKIETLQWFTVKMIRLIKTIDWWNHLIAEIIWLIK